MTGARSAGKAGVAGASAAAGVFGGEYADAYDLLYEQKDYPQECDFVETMFRRLAKSPRTVLDVGCGTGGHAFILAKRGYEVTGVDLSESMLRIAREKNRTAQAGVDFRQGDARDVALGKTFDAVISMFAVMGYQATNADVMAACRTARRHLEPGGVFLFDAWYGPGVLSDPPRQRIRVLTDGDHRVIRITDALLDAAAHTVETRFQLLTLEGTLLKSEITETHLVRFFFPLELALYLESSGFGAVSFCPFLRPGEALSQDTWSFAAAAIAV